MNNDLVEVTAELIMNRIAEWSMALTFEEHVLLMQELTERIRMSLNALEEMPPFGQCHYWEYMPGKDGGCIAR